MMTVVAENERQQDDAGLGGERFGNKAGELTVIRLKALREINFDIKSLDQRSESKNSKNREAAVVFEDRYTRWVIDVHHPSLRRKSCHCHAIVHRQLRWLCGVGHFDGFRDLCLFPQCIRA